MKIFNLTLNEKEYEIHVIGAMINFIFQKFL